MPTAVWTTENVPGLISKIKACSLEMSMIPDARIIELALINYLDKIQASRQR